MPNPWQSARSRRAPGRSCPSLEAPPRPSLALGGAARPSAPASQAPAGRTQGILPCVLKRACPPWRSARPQPPLAHSLRLPFRTHSGCSSSGSGRSLGASAALAGPLPAGRAPGQKSRRHPARGQLRWTVAACSRQAAPGFAPASPGWAAVAAAPRIRWWLLIGLSQPLACAGSRRRPVAVAAPQQRRPQHVASLGPARAGPRLRYRPRPGTGSCAVSSTSLPSVLPDL